MMPQIQGDFEQDSKVIRTRNDNGYEFTIKIDAFDGDRSILMDDAGYGGHYQMFTIVGGGNVYSHYDPRKLRRKHPALASGLFTYKLMCALHDGRIDFASLDHDTEYYKGDVEEILNDRQD